MFKKKLLFIMLLFAVLVLSGVENIQKSIAEESVNEGSNRSDAMQKQKKEFDAHRQYVKIHFDDDEMDFILQWVLGSTPLGGCEIGEAFYTAGQIEDGNPTSWQNQWAIMAERTEKRGNKSAEGGHKVSAREAYLRASNYYRNALVSMYPSNTKYKVLGNKSRECMKKAGELLNPPMEYFEIPFEGTVLPGYFWKAKKSDKKTKTLVMIGGGETHIEDNYFYIAPEAHKRGYNFVTIDLPGQGLMPFEGQFYGADSEVPIKSLMDYILSRPDVDPEKVAMYGISGGGYYVPRAATKEKRIKAIAVNSAIIDQEKVFANMPIAKATPEVLKTWPAFKRQTAGVIAWRAGLDLSNVIGLVAANKGFIYDPKDVTCPALILIGEGEYSSDTIKEEQKKFYDNISSPEKRFIVTPANQGASSHCIGENRSVMSQVVFDWFDEVFDNK